MRGSTSDPLLLVPTEWPFLEASAAILISTTVICLPNQVLQCDSTEVHGDCVAPHFDKEELLHAWPMM